LIRDVRETTGADLLEGSGVGVGELTLLFGCPPCQSFTILRRGAEETVVDGARNSLPRQYSRLVEELQPRHVAFENVPGMVDERWRHRFDELLAELPHPAFGTASLSRSVGTAEIINHLLASGNPRATAFLCPPPPRTTSPGRPGPDQYAKDQWRQPDRSAAREISGREAEQ
jgi:C-5 cytosine-specific DNA methylase